MLLFHITDPQHWEDCLDSGEYDHPSRKTEGFIHCSTRLQLRATLDLHFPDVSEVIILHIVEKRVREIVRWEAREDGEEFPHLYGIVELYAIEDVSIGERDENGVWDPETLPLLPNQPPPSDSL